MEMMVNSHNPDFGTLSSFIVLTWILAFYLETLNLYKIQSENARFVHSLNTYGSYSPVRWYIIVYIWTDIWSAGKSTFYV